MATVTKLNGVAWTSLAKLNGIAKASIAKVNGMSAATSLKTNLIAYYALEEASGNITDSHGAKTVTVAGTAAQTTGFLANTRNISGATSAMRDDDPDFEPGSGKLFFVTLWAKAASLSQSSYPGLVSKSLVSGDQREWGVQFNDATNKAYLSVTSLGTAATEVAIAADTAFADTSTWYFIAAGCDGINIMISINGGAFQATAYSSNIFAGIAKFELGGRSGGTNKFNGLIDEVAFWKGRCLTIGEVQTIYAAGSGLAYASWT